MTTAMTAIINATMYRITVVFFMLQKYVKKMIRTKKNILPVMLILNICLIIKV